MSLSTGLPNKMIQLKLTDKSQIYNSYMPFLENGGLFVPTDDTLSLEEEVLLVLEIAPHHDKKYLRTKVAWINPVRTSPQRPKGVGLAFDADESNIQVKNLIESELGKMLLSDRITYTL